MNLLPLAQNGDAGELLFYAILALVGVAVGLLRKSRAKKDQAPSAQRPPPTPRRPARSPEPSAPPDDWREVILGPPQDRQRAEGQPRSEPRAAEPPPPPVEPKPEPAKHRLRPAAAARTRRAPSTVGLDGDLASAEQLARAVIHYEILAPPKALRTTPEPWEL